MLKKLLSAEPDNLRIQIRLADLYQAMGQSGEALETYVSAAQRALARGDHAECEKLADKALQISPKHLDALIVKARAFSTVGNVAKASDILERVPDLEKGGEPAELLLDLYLKNAKWDEATGLALRIFASDEKNFGATQKVTEVLMESGQAERAMSLLSRIRIPMIDAGEHEGVTHLLTELSTRLPGRLEPLEWLVDTYGRTSDSFRMPDALAHLGDALLASGKLERARDVFQQLVDREPESEPAKRKLNDVLKKMGAVEEDATPPADIVVVTEDLQPELAKAPAPKVRPGLEEEQHPKLRRRKRRHLRQPSRNWTRKPRSSLRNRSPMWTCLPATGLRKKLSDCWKRFCAALRRIRLPSKNCWTLCWEQVTIGGRLNLPRSWSTFTPVGEMRVAAKDLENCAGASSGRRA